MWNHPHLLPEQAYTEFVSEYAEGFLERHFKLTNPRLEPLSRDEGHNHLSPVLDQAYDNGAITFEEEFVDIAVSGTIETGERFYVVAEVSYPVTHRDVARAETTARLLHRKTRLRTIPATTGNDTSEEAVAWS